MRIASITAVAVLGLLTLSGPVGCRRAPQPPPSKAPPGLSVAERVRVLNADVYVIDGRHIRLADAVAPQPIPDARCWAEALAAKQATLEARELVRSAQTLRVVPTGQTDEYNRIVANIILDGQDLGRTLHDAGLAAEVPSRRFGWCEPISQGGAGAPDLRSLMDFSRG